MIKTQKQIQENFLKTCAKINGREYVSESEQDNQHQKKDLILKRLQLIKQDCEDVFSKRQLTNHKFSMDNNDASQLVIKLKELAMKVERSRSYCSSLGSFRKHHS